MSTPSKKRRAARAWMHAEVKEREKLIAQARVAGRADILRDARTLLPEPDGVYPNERGGTDIISVIKKFPSPYEGVPVFRVPMPMLTPFHRDGFMSKVRIPERVRFVDFRPIENALTIQGSDGSTSLRWFTWEPSEDGGNDCSKRTRALFTGMTKLAFCARELTNHVEYSLPPSHLAEVARLVHECAEELRLRLGEFAPKTELDQRRERYIFRSRHPHMDTRWGQQW